MKARGIALLIGVPLALATFELPTEAMNISGLTSVKNVLIPREQASVVVPPSESGGEVLAVFTTRKIREQALAVEQERLTFSIDAVREQFFKTNVPYGSIIYREARRHNLSPELVAAIVEAESDFRPRLISHKNAQGLMQIIPETGRLMGAEDLFNPADNIAAGTKYLRYLFNRFGDPRLVLAAYNAGEGNVEKFGGVPPFPETITYLQRVSTRTNLYRQRFRGTYLATLRLRPPVAAH
jgi:soluble lytic murein transglycosylase-like protein